MKISSCFFRPEYKCRMYINGMKKIYLQGKPEMFRQIQWTYNLIFHLLIIIRWTNTVPNKL